MSAEVQRQGERRVLIGPQECKDANSSDGQNSSVFFQSVNFVSLCLCVQFKS